MIANSVAPGNPYLGVMLPYSPLHHLLLAELAFPVVATSGNLSEEPICTDEHEALHRLAGLADAFLVHDRPIIRHVDDSVVRVVLGEEMILRRVRGYAPLPVSLPKPVPALLSVGGHLKNTVAVSAGTDVFISQHVGDLETAQAFDAFQSVQMKLREMFEITPQAVACDQHPDYLSTQFARRSGLQVIPVQHHYAHVLSCMAENHLDGSVLGVSWDGTGYGTDNTVWGGEFLQVTSDSYRRVAHLRMFRLPGGDKAIKEPRRSALGLLYQLFGVASFAMEELPSIRAFSRDERAVLGTMLQRGINCPFTSSAGRLFDGVAALAGFRPVMRFEGQAAMELEFAVDGVVTDERYEFDLVTASDQGAAGPLILDWARLVRSVLYDAEFGTAKALIAAKFHNTLAEMIVAVAQSMCQERVVLTGGCFQNKYLTERVVRRLRESEFHPYWHHRVPPNDGGIALGQILAAARELTRR